MEIVLIVLANRRDFLFSAERNFPDVSVSFAEYQRALISKCGRAKYLIRQLRLTCNNVISDRDLRVCARGSLQSLKKFRPQLAADPSRDSRSEEGVECTPRNPRFIGFFLTFPGVILNEFRSERFFRRRKPLPISHDGTATFHTLPFINYCVLKIIDRSIFDIDICARMFRRLCQKGEVCTLP